MHDPRASIAANNNADFYEAVFSAHHRPFERLDYAFVGRGIPPPYDSNLTVLAPGFKSEVLAELGGLSSSFGGAIGFKDSFCEFDLAAEGFRTLFKAQWLWHLPRPNACPADWHRIDNAHDLSSWENAWKQNGSPAQGEMFTNDLLGDPDFAFFGTRSGAEYVGGCIANKSAKCVGISNIFSRGNLRETVVAAKAAAGSVDPALPITGYATGSLLRAAHQAGFEIVGDLQILATDQARL